MDEEPRPFRRSPRVPTECAVLVKKVGDGGVEVLATTRTVSSGGCTLVHQELLGVGTEVDILISLPGRVIRPRGRIIWENERASGEVEVGVEFLRVSAEDRRALEATIATQASTRR